MRGPSTIVVLAFALVTPVFAGCFFLPYRPDGADPWGTYPHGSDPDIDDDLDGFTETEGDCDDEDEEIYPGAIEVENGLDDDCDGEVDEPPDPIDLDGDGWTAEDGDCDDENAAIHPNHSDDCDEWDNDCDGELNEDVGLMDPAEPNDTSPNNLGDLTNAVATVVGYLHNPQDVDRFSCQVEDTFLGDFGVDVELAGVPGSADYVLELWHDGSLIGYSDTSGGEDIHFGGDTWDDDSGTYEVVIYSVLGFNCSQPYVLMIKASG